MNRFEQFINENYEAAEEQWNKDIKEIYSWVKSLENDRVIIEYRKQNNSKAAICRYPLSRILPLRFYQAFL